MSRTKSLSGNCQHCGGHIRFPAESVGLTTACPHCGQTTDLLLALPPQEPTVPIKTVVYTIIAVLILVGGLVGALIAVNRLQRAAEQRIGASNPTSTGQATSPKPADPFAQAGFGVSTVTLEKTQGSSLVYAVGTIRNETDRRRFGVKVEIELLDASGNKAGTATDYQQTLESKAEWSFKALVLDSKAASAKIVSIKEDQ
jgi:hypothetical protein